MYSFKEYPKIDLISMHNVIEFFRGDDVVVDSLSYVHFKSKTLNNAHSVMRQFPITTYLNQRVMMKLNYQSRKLNAELQTYDYITYI